MDVISSPSLRRSDRAQKKRKEFNPYDNPYEERENENKKRKIETSVFRQTRPMCLQLLSELRNHKYSLPFDKPVNPILDGVPDYFLVIKKPMDFQTVQNQMKALVYSSAEEFAMDIRLIFSNCWTYNHPASEIVRQAKVLSSFFESKYKAIREFEESSFEEASVQEMQDMILELQKEHKKLLAELARLQEDTLRVSELSTNGWQSEEGSAPSVASPTLPSSPKLKNGRQKRSSPSKSSPVPSPNSVPIQPQTPSKQPKQPDGEKDSSIPIYGYEEKKILNDNILTLQQEDLEKMIEIMANDFTFNGEEVEIDLEKLSNETIHKMNIFVNDCILKKQQQQQQDQNH